ncbi:helix-turn-helix domain-containing protein [Cellulomonas sp. URHB0016]
MTAHVTSGAKSEPGVRLVPLAYTRQEAAVMLRTSKSRIDQAIHSSQLKAKQMGRRIVIPAKALDDYLDSLPDV